MKKRFQSFGIFKIKWEMNKQAAKRINGVSFQHLYYTCYLKLYSTLGKSLQHIMIELITVREDRNWNFLINTEPLASLSGFETLIKLMYKASETALPKNINLKLLYTVKVT